MTAFADWHLRLVQAIQDVKPDGSSIVLATDDGKKRTSAQRSKDLMAARYWAWSIFRIANKTLFFVETTKLSIAGTGEGFTDITSLNITTPEEMVVRDTSVLFKKPLTVVDGDVLPLFRVLLQTSDPNEIVAGIIVDLSGSSQKVQLNIVLGASLNQDLSLYNFLLGYYANPKLEELTAASVNDITEPRLWWDAIERYAEYLAWKNSGNFQRAQHARDEAVDLLLTIVEIEHGESAKARATQVLRKQR